MQHKSIAAEFAATVLESGRYTCPECNADRKKHNRLDFNVTVEADQNLYICHHCLASGKVPTRKPIEVYKPKPKPVLSHIPTPLHTNHQTILSFFASRGVDATNLDLSDRVITSKKYFAQLGAELDAIGFVYGTEDDGLAIKWRPASDKKAFTQDGAARMFYGLRPLGKDEKQVVIVEGEADVIALASVGITSWSVPNGAPMKVSNGKIDPEEDTKFAYLWDAWEELSTAKQIILATDNDTAGNALKQEITRRIGLENCWEIFLPEDCKDVTDVLRDKGSDAVKNLFTNIKQMPLKGVYDVDSYFDAVETLYRDGLASTESTGLPAVDELFKMKEGMLYIVTGYPGCGKSEFIDQIMINLAQEKHWKWAVASFENQPPEHIAKLIEKITAKPFFEGINQRLSHNELIEAKDFLKEHFVFLEQKDGKMATIQDIIARIKLAIVRCGIRGAVIDPYNYIDMSSYESEHSGISQMLSELTAFAKAKGVAIFFVAHPQKLLPNPDGALPVPTGSHISGSAAWWAKADIGFTVYRKDWDVEIHCWKSRFKWLGKQGKTNINYNIVNGKYSDGMIKKAKQWGEVDF